MDEGKSHEDYVRECLAYLGLDDLDYAHLVSVDRIDGLVYDEYTDEYLTEDEIAGNIREAEKASWGL